MRTFAVDDNNDMVLGEDGNMSILTGIAGIAQASVQYMRTRRGEMIHAVDQGIPYDPVVWGSSPNIAQFEAAGRARLMQVPGVLEVLSFQARQEGEILGYTATIRTTLGETQING